MFGNAYLRCISCVFGVVISIVTLLLEVIINILQNRWMLQLTENSLNPN